MDENNISNQELSESSNQSIREDLSTSKEVVEAESMPKTVDINKGDRDKEINKEIAALSYIWVLSVPIFYLRKDSC